MILAGITDAAVPGQHVTADPTVSIASRCEPGRSCSSRPPGHETPW